jgi:hypothetical protein
MKVLDERIPQGRAASPFPSRAALRARSRRGRPARPRAAIRDRESRSPMRRSSTGASAPLILRSAPPSLRSCAVAALISRSNQPGLVAAIWPEKPICCLRDYAVCGFRKRSISARTPFSICAKASSGGAQSRSCTCQNSTRGRYCGNRFCRRGKCSS